MCFPSLQLVYSWVSSMVVGTLIEWLATDIAIIWFRSKLAAFSKRIRTIKYQVGEKMFLRGFGVAPWLSGVASGAAKLVRL